MKAVVVGSCALGTESEVYYEFFPGFISVPARDVAQGPTYAPSRTQCKSRGVVYDVVV